MCFREETLAYGEEEPPGAHPIIRSEEKRE
jgi:hypothetical protein